MKFLLALFFSISAYAAENNIQSANLYERLGLTAKATREEIAKAFRVLARQYHPDLLSDKSTSAIEAANVNMAKINEAYEILRDGEKRAQYDESLVAKPDAFDNLGGERDNYERDENSAREARKAQKNLKEIVAIFPILKEVADYAFKRYVEFNLPSGPRWSISPQPFHIWPTDLKIIEAILATNSSHLLWTLTLSILTLPTWEQHSEWLVKVIEKNDSYVNSRIGEFMYSDHWVNANGAKVLETMIDRGYYMAVARSLGMAGSIGRTVGKKTVWGKAWYDIPEGVIIMKKLIAEADRHTLKWLDYTLTDEGWKKAFLPFEEFKKLSYISAVELHEVYKDKKFSVRGAVASLSSAKTCPGLFRAPTKKPVLLLE